MNVLNPTPRKVKCIRNDNCGLLLGTHNHHLLEVGKIYEMETLVMSTWHSFVHLKEFPNKSFHCMAFDEVE